MEGFVVCENYQFYLWKRTKESKTVYVKKRADDSIVFKGKVPERLIVIGISDSKPNKFIYKRRKIDCNKISSVCEYFKLIALEYTSPSEQIEEGFMLWDSTYGEDPAYRTCTIDKIKSIKKKHLCKVIEMYYN